ncbi:MAG: FtsX-like permease family protein [Planctomycetota bacterium]
MMKKYQVLISQRYFRSRMVNIIAVVAVTLGVAALIIVSSVMDGFARDIEARIRGIMSHVIVESDRLIGIDDYDSLTERIRRVPNVAACAPLAESPVVLIRANDKTAYGQLRGIDPAREGETSEITQSLENLREEADKPPADSRHEEVRHRFAQGLVKPEGDPLFGGPGDLPGVLIGIELAMQLGVQRGDVITITSATTIMDVQTQKFRVAGGFRTRHYTYDSQLVYVKLEDAQDLLGLPNRVTSISVRLEDRKQMAETRRAVERAIRAPAELVDPGRPETLDRIELSTGEPVIVGDEERWLRLGSEDVEYTRLEIPHAGEVFRRADRPTALAFTVRTTEGGSAPMIRVSVIGAREGPEGVERVPYRAFDYELRQAPGVMTDVPVPELMLLHRRRSGLGRGRPQEPSAWLAIGPGQTVELVAVLANLETDDHLDLLHPAQTERVVFEVRGPAVEIRGVRFEDYRPVRVTTWREKQANFLKAVRIERYIQVIIMSLMVVIAGFSILAILWLMVREKTRDIGILVSLGATRAGIVRVFLLNGLLIGLIGGALGLASGWTVSVNLNVIEEWIYRVFHWKVFPPDIYYLDRLPHQEDPATFVTMALIAAAVSLAAALWPAIKAARLDPVEALRYE